MLGPILLSIHNLTYYQRLLARARQAIAEDRFAAFYEERRRGWAAGVRDDGCGIGFRPPDFRPLATASHPPLPLVALHLMMAGLSCQAVRPARPERRAVSVRRPFTLIPPRSDSIPCSHSFNTVWLLAQDAAGARRRTIRTRSFGWCCRWSSSSGLFYFLMLRPQKKKEDEFQAAGRQSQGKRPHRHDRRHSRRRDQRAAGCRPGDDSRRRIDRHQAAHQHVGDRPRGHDDDDSNGASSGGKSK